MSSWFTAFLFSIGATAWGYVQLGRMNGNPNPGSNMALAGIGGLVVFIFFFTLLKFVLHF